MFAWSPMRSRNDGQIPRDAVSPKPGLPTPVLCQNRRIRPKLPMRMHHSARQTGEQLGLRLRRVELAQRHLAVRPSHFENALGQSRILVLLNQPLRRFLRVRYAGDDHDLGAFPGFQHDGLPDGHDRIEHRTLGIGKSRLLHCRRALDRSPPPNKPAPIRLIRSVRPPPYPEPLSDGASRADAPGPSAAGAYTISPGAAE